MASQKNVIKVDDVRTAAGIACSNFYNFPQNKVRLIGITGTNGKSTLTALLDNAFSLSGLVSLAAGNIGYPFSDAVISEANQSEAYVVLEISTFQA